MDVTEILEALNPEQRAAVTAPPGSALVLAGAGSGKTRVLTQRIAWLVQTEGISPFGILAVTFTNKAAAEMRARIEEHLKMPLRGMWVGTFHGLAHRFLRAHWQDAGLDQNFQIIDADDQLRLVKRILSNLSIDDKKWPAKQAVWWINAQKDEGLRSNHIQNDGDLFLATHLSIYRAYEEACERGGMVDFAELLLRTHETLLSNQALLQHYQDRFKAVLVDEFQDTNAIQYAWLRIITGQADKLMVVGDDDQSIYGWRGAKIENIQRFQDDFPSAVIYRLEQNYRSTGAILGAANALIENNDDRLGKQLWTDLGDGDPLSLYAAYNEIDEARYIVERIKTYFEGGHPYQDCAILYRSNAQSRVLEEALLRSQLPYRIYGGQRFFERAEIRSSLAYLKLISQRQSDAAFERVVNLPPRGIGDKSVQKIRDRARENQESLWQAASHLITSGEFTARATTAVSGFLKLIDDLDAATDNLDLAHMVQETIDAAGLKTFYEREGGERGQARLENLEELIAAAETFDPEDMPLFDDGPQVEMTLLDEFLSHASLEAGEGRGEPNQDSVQMMTMHSAKGLEFPVVFLAGMEEGLFPHQMSVDEPGRMEEERRLCYVGLTRAMQKLHLTYAEARRLNGSDHYNRASRFVQEIPNTFVEEVRAHESIVRPAYETSHTVKRVSSAVEGTSFELGQKVGHAKFGEGVILNYEGQGQQARVQVKFEQAGTKWLMLSFAKLQPI
ncbi:MAG: DNA helicase II [Pseudomonadales bacterium]